jgi:glycosyltransferase involved in cell wall biosynthesis
VRYPEKYILFIGRIRKYKGVENLVQAFDKLEINDFQLVIAGEGKLKIRHDPRIKLFNHWLAEDEIASLIEGSEVVVFPYVEASQSGILPYCLDKNKKVVITPLPGLLEQSVTYKNVFVTKDLEVDSLKSTLDLAIHSETLATGFKAFKTKNIESCLLESGLFTKK